MAKENLDQHKQRPMSEVTTNVTPISTISKEKKGNNPPAILSN